ncbi:unnamed protein product [Prorocentrum cordatum]|uniref:Uncharacterized protein n=1 Tax=Prorocentrum cordatum TaxID=2364126 RepID=A0ABN9RXQ0_9DINO|nr:unnamed protein product [Polarella glacialis]
MTGSPRHQSISQVQAKALETLVNWYGHRDLNVLQALASSAHGPMGPARQRAKSHNFLALVSHVTAAGWDRLLEEGVPPSAVQSMLVQRIIRLGGAHADEHSLKLANSAFMLVTMPDRVETMSYYDKKKYYDNFKTAYHRVAEKSPRPSAYMLELPQTPQDLLASLPTVYHAAFSAKPGGGPAACPLDMRFLRDLEASYRCRGAAPACSGRASGAASQELATRAPPNQMEQCMQQQMQMQQMTQMMQMAFGAVAGSMRGGQSAAPTGGGDLLDNLTVFGAARRPGGHPALAMEGAARAGSSDALTSLPQAAAPTAGSQHAGPPNVTSSAEGSQQIVASAAAPPTQSQPIVASAAAPPTQSQPAVASAAASAPPAAEPAVELARPLRMDIKTQVEEAMSMMLHKKNTKQAKKRPAACQAADEREQENEDGEQGEVEDLRSSPMARGRPTAKTAAKPKAKPKDAATTTPMSKPKVQALISDIVVRTGSDGSVNKNTLASRMYSRAKKRAADDGYSHDASVEVAKKAYGAAAAMWDAKCS